MSTKAKILYYDLETAPNLAFVWGKYEQDVIAYKQEWALLSFAYKWEGQTKIQVHSQRTLSEEQLVKKLHKVLSSADIIIAHNGDQFDYKKANAKFIEYNLTPPAPVQSIDTKKVAKRYFAFNSNKLNDLCTLLKIGQKAETGGFQLWLDCMAGKKTAWLKMERYNKHDVELLEPVYKRLRPWISNHPNTAALEGKPDGCPKCGDKRLRSNGIRRTKLKTYRRYSCLGCGGWSHSPVALKIMKPKLVN